MKFLKTLDFVSRLRMKTINQIINIELNTEWKNFKTTTKNELIKSTTAKLQRLEIEDLLTLLKNLKENSEMRQR